jgi:redox-sensitive bicupin YhaK (pirin superfamily)
MLTIRKAEERGHANHGWLDSHHTFSFADYYDPAHMGFGPLRVLNDDTVSAGNGFPPHRHRDMEIISYVLEGALEHKDNIGNGSIIKPGDVQRMSAGPGVMHSEFNASKESPVHFLQIWVLPKRPGLPAGYEQKYFGDDEKRGRLRLVASPDGTDGSVRIQQDLRMFATLVGGGASVSHDLTGRKGWLHVARGTAVVNGMHLNAGDGAAIESEDTVSISSHETAEVLLFEFAG